MVYLMRMLKLPTARHETIWGEAAADGKPKFCGRCRNEMGTLRTAPFYRLVRFRARATFLS